MTPTAALLIWTSLSWNVSESAFGHGDCSNRYRGREVLEQGLAGAGGIGYLSITTVPRSCKKKTWSKEKCDS
ncbi:hypothetical protein CSTAT_00080 [Corynebacterium stationis]|nr:hypothetical protein CSTAT_00080 [Corynebacterium stationis]